MTTSRSRPASTCFVVGRIAALPGRRCKIPLKRSSQFAQPHQLNRSAAPSRGAPASSARTSLPSQASRREIPAPDQNPSHVLRESPPVSRRPLRQYVLHTLLLVRIFRGTPPVSTCHSSNRR